MRERPRIKRKPMSSPNIQHKTVSCSVVSRIDVFVRYRRVRVRFVRPASFLCSLAARAVAQQAAPLSLDMSWREDAQSTGMLATWHGASLEKPGATRSTAGKTTIRTNPLNHDTNPAMRWYTGSMDRLANNETYWQAQVEEGASFFGKASPHPAPFVAQFRPRVERCPVNSSRGSMTMYHQAMAGTLGALDTRASSVAYPKDVTTDCRSLAHKLLHAPYDGMATRSQLSGDSFLAGDQPRYRDTRSGPTLSMFGPNPNPISKGNVELASTPGPMGTQYLADGVQPPLHHQKSATSNDARAPGTRTLSHFGSMGERVLSLVVARLSKDHYNFSLGLDPMVPGNPNAHHHHKRPLHPGSKTLDAGEGYILDSDSVLTAGQKLHDKFGANLPMFVKMGDGCPPGTEASRRTRVRLLFRGRMLDEHMRLGPQCLAEAFSKYF